MIIIKSLKKNTVIIITIILAVVLIVGILILNASKERELVVSIETRIDGISQYSYIDITYSLYSDNILEIHTSEFTQDGGANLNLKESREISSKQKRALIKAIKQFEEEDYTINFEKPRYNVLYNGGIIIIPHQVEKDGAEVNTEFHDVIVDIMK